MENIKILVEKLNDTENESVKENCETDICQLLYTYTDKKCKSLFICEKTPERLENYITNVSDNMFKQVITGNYDYDKIFTNSLYCRNCYERCPKFHVMDLCVFCKKCYIAHFDLLVDNIQNTKPGKSRDDISHKIYDFLADYVQSQRKR